MPESRASITSRSVMTFVTLAGGKGLWESFSKSIFPLSRSSKTADGEESSGGTAKTVVNKNSKQSKKEEMRFKFTPPK